MSFLANLFGAQEEQQRADTLDAQLAALNKRDYGEGGTIYQTIAARDGVAAAEQARLATDEHLATQVAQDRDIAGQIDTAFDTQLASGASGIGGFVGNTIKGVFGTVFRILPWWLWLLVAAGAFFYFGGWTFVARRLAQRSST